MLYYVGVFRIVLCGADFSGALWGIVLYGLGPPVFSGNGAVSQIITINNSNNTIIISIVNINNISIFAML